MHWWDKGQINKRKYIFCIHGMYIWRDYFNQNRTGLVVDILHYQSIVSTAIFFLFSGCSNELTKIVGRLWLGILSLSNIRIFNPPSHFFDHCIALVLLKLWVLIPYWWCAYCAYSAYFHRNITGLVWLITRPTTHSCTASSRHCQSIPQLSLFELFLRPFPWDSDFGIHALFVRDPFIIMALPEFVQTCISSIST